MIATALDIVSVVFLFVVGFVTGWIYAQLRLQRQTASDSVLMIKKPRLYVDEDGRSDFRPELREAADRRRMREGR